MLKLATEMDVLCHRVGRKSLDNVRYLHTGTSSVNSNVKDWSGLKIHTLYKPNHVYIYIYIYIYIHVEGLFSKSSWGPGWGLTG